MKNIIIAVIISSIIQIVLYFDLSGTDGWIFSRLHKIETDLNSLSIRSSCDLAFSSKNFSTVNTQLGIYLISSEGISPRGTGSRVSLKIGNITSAGSSNFKIIIITEERDTNKEITTEKDFSETLAPGRWNIVTIDIPELTPNQLKDTFSAQLYVGSVALPEPK